MWRVELGCVKSGECEERWERSLEWGNGGELRGAVWSVESGAGF